MSEMKMGRRIWCALTVLCLCATLAGCAGWYDGERWMTMDVDRERLMRLEPFRTTEMTLDKEMEGESEGEGGAEGQADAASGEREEAPAEVELTIDECRAAALAGNLELKVVLVDPSIATEGIVQQEAVFEPFAFGGFNFRKTDTPTSTALDGSQSESTSFDFGVNVPLRTGGTLSFDIPYNKFQTDNVFSTLNPSYTADFSASLSQPLLRNAGLKASTHGIRISRYNQWQSQARTKLEVIRVLAGTDRIYWRLYGGRRQLEVRINEHELALRQLERVKRRVDAGVSSRAEIVRAETGVAEKLEGIIIAENVVRRRERDLKRAMQREGLEMETSTAIVPVTEPNPVHYDFDLAALAAASVANRMEMLETQLQIAKETSTIDFQRNRALPALGLSYNYRANGLGDDGGDAFEVLFDKNFEDHSVGLFLEVPIGNAAARSRVRAALLARIRSIATRDRREAQIHQEVYNAVDDVEMNWQRVLANRQRTIMTARNLKAEERQFEEGLRTSTEVLEAQTRLGDAQAAEINSVAQYQISLVELAVATGTLPGAAMVEWAPRALASTEE